MLGMDEPPAGPGPMMPPPPPGEPDPSSPGYGLREGHQPRQMARTAPPASRLPGLLVLAGGVAVAIGTFLPWLQATGPAGTVTENGLKIGAWVTLILGGLAAIRGLALLRPRTLRVPVGSPVISGVLIAILVALRWNYLQQTIRNTEALGPGIDAGLGVGVWVVLAGAGLIIAGGLLLSGSRRL